MEGPDGRSVARSFGRRAAGFAKADFLHAEIRGRLLERFELITVVPSVVAELGAGPGLALDALNQRFAPAAVIALDRALPMLRAIGPEKPAWRLCADAHRLPLHDASVDVVFSNLMLHWCSDMAAVLAEVRRVLRHPGLFSFSTFGPRTLGELRAAWAAADRHTHVLDFPAMQGLGDALIRAGFAEPVLDCERLTVTYADPDGLVADLRAVGATNLTAGRSRGLTSRARWARLQQAYLGQRGSDGRIPATFEVIYAQAWAGAPRGGAGRPAGEVEIPLDAVRRRAR
jgi:malonyl-CoA O-methyltransferase